MIELHFPWTSDYEIGDDHIDSQHHRLIDLANLLLEASHRHQEEAVVHQALEALKAYAAEHFAEEEAFFRKIHSPLLSEHIAQHRALTQEIEAFRLDDTLGFIALGETVAIWVRDRLVPHMIVDDQKALMAGRT
ncbi:bacteriohemerythrin [Rhodospirillum sp. A1_3_36]|uniref:bacteriohemerythrin n=1 Tax=Rhodospirillum sp. A1_3_36 TaxID=3391666 RepID=UPI0039A4CEAE